MSSTVRLWKLDGIGYELLAEASAGDRFEVAEPFTMAFDPIEPLDR